jgi:hypothetical protein
MDSSNSIEFLRRKPTMTDDGPRDDSTFKPDPPQKVNFYQVLILFVYHILLAVFLAYSIYNVWPPQPWPGDTAQARAEAAKTEAAKISSQAEAAGPTASSPGAPKSAGTSSNSRGGGNANVATNANAASNSNQNLNAAGTASPVNPNSAPPNDTQSGASAAEPSTAVYGGERPPPFWLFGYKFQPTLEVRLLLLVLLAGAIGSYIHASSSFVDYLGNRTLISSWVWWYLLRPFIGMMLALLFYFVFRGGFITAGVNQGGEAAASFINPFGIAAMAGLVGMFSKVAADKLNEVFLTMFAPKAGQGDAKRGDKLSAGISPVVGTIVPNVGPKEGGTPVTITGTDFFDGVGITFGGVAASGISFKDATKVTATTPPHAPGIVDVEVTNPNKLKSVFTGGFTYLGDDGGASAGSVNLGAAGSDANVETIDGCGLEVVDHTPDEALPITEGGVE